MKHVAAGTFVVLGVVLQCVDSTTLATKSPVEQVVKLLKDLKETLIEDGEREKKIYRRYACWCEKATKQKAEAIHASYAKSKVLIENILKLKAEIAVYAGEIQDLTDERTKELDLRKNLDVVARKANVDFRKETREDFDTLTAAETALRVLRKATEDMREGEFLQVESAEEAHARKVQAVKAVLASVPLQNHMPFHSVSLLSEFAESDYRYAPQSITIQGILRDMYTSTAADVMRITSTEADRNRAYEQNIELSDVKLKQIQEQIDDKKKKKAVAALELAQETRKYDNNDDGYKADIKFFDVTTSSCSMKADEYEQRVEMRAAELDGVQKAYDLLRADLSRAKFAKAMQGGTGVGVFTQKKAATSFLQVRSKDESTAQASILKAYNAVKAQAKKLHSYRLAEMAVSIRTAKVGYFQGVIEQMDTLVGVLKGEGQDDIVKRDECVSEYKKSNETMEDLNWKIGNSEIKIEGLASKVKLMYKEKLEAIDEKAVQEANLATLTEERNAAYQEYQDTQQDDEAAISLLEQAKEFLVKFFNDQGIALGPLEGDGRMALSQKSQQQSQKQSPVFKKTIEEGVEADFSKKDSRSLSSKTIISMISHLITDVQGEIYHGGLAEAKSVQEYQEAKAALDDVIENLRIKIDDLDDAMAEKWQEKTAEEGTLATNQFTLGTEKAYKVRITPDCDWILGAFQERADKRAAEIRGLQEAKEYLAGKQPPAALMQNGAKADDSWTNPFAGLASISK